MFQTRCEYSKHVSNVSNALLIFKTRFKCFKRIVQLSKKHVVNVSTALHYQRVANSRKN